MITRILRRLRNLPALVRYGSGLAAAGVAASITYLLPPLHSLPFLVCFPAVVLVSLFFGQVSGILCAVACAAVIEDLVVHPVFTLSPRPPGSITRVAAFLIISLILGWGTRALAKLAEVSQSLVEEAEAKNQLLRDKDERLELALSGGGMGLWDWDLKNDTLFWSASHYRILGLEPNSQPPSYSLLTSRIHPEDLAAAELAMKVTRNNGESYICEYRVIWPDGSTHWLEGQAQYHKDSSGNVVRMLGVLSDVTDRKNAAHALLRTEKLAVAGRMAASIAHEINNPLESVANLLYLIAQSESLPQAHADATLALQELMRASHITQQTLRFHRQSEYAKPARLSEIVNAVLSLFHGKITAPNIAVDRRYDDDPELVCLTGDLQQVFANIILNAIDAMPSGGKLVIRTRLSRNWINRAHQGMRITIADSGIGMERAIWKHIYEPFFTNKPETGTGLGMWVVAQIVERQRGDIHVWSSTRKGSSGTVYSLFLPIEDRHLGRRP